MSFIYFVKFISRCFIIFEGIVNGTVFLYSFSVYSLFVYRNSTDFYILILYPATLLNVFMRSISFLMIFEGLRYKIISCTNRDDVTSPFLIWIPFVSSSCLIALARNYSTILNKNEENGHPRFIPDFRGNDVSFSPFSMMLAIGLLYIDFIMLKYVPYIPSFSRAFIMRRY
jgi:hypothetical protein